MSEAVLAEKVQSRWPIVTWTTALFAAYFCLVSALGHLGNPYQFVAAIRAYQLIPIAHQVGAEIVAIFLPFVHLTLAVCLITKYAQRSAFGVGFFLFFFYTLAQASVLARGLKAGCGCFGPSEDLIGVKSIALSLTCSLGCYIGLYSLRSQRPMSYRSGLPIKTIKVDQSDE